MKHAAMENDLRSRGAVANFVGRITNDVMRPILRDILGGDKALPAVLSLDSVEQALAQLQKMIFKNARLFDDGLHDFKGLFKVLMALIYLSSSKAVREGIAAGLTSIGEGDRKAQKGRDVRKVGAAYAIVYADCTDSHRTTMKIMTMLSACGMYLPPEKREAKHIVLYAFLAVWLEVLVEEEFRHRPCGTAYKTNERLKRSKITAGGLFGRYWKAVIGDNVLGGWLGSLWHGLTERPEELFAKIKLWVFKNINGSNVAQSVLDNVEFRSAFHDCYSSKNGDSEFTRIFRASMDADVDEPNLAAEWLVTHRPAIPVLSSDQYGIILVASS